MASTDSSFNATGSTVVAFETLSVGDRAIGVGVNGTQCGVHGEGGASPLGTRKAPFATGVHGHGDLVGVSGEGPLAGGLFSNTSGLFGCFAQGTLVGMFAQSTFWGVRGSGNVGPGVQGDSTSDRGGVFSSKTLAQMKLVPSTRSSPPATGQVGDLFLMQPNPTDPNSVKLFLCVKDGAQAFGAPIGTPALWAPIQLGPFVVGT
jgi:hypothetical protein